MSLGMVGLIDDVAPGGGAFTVWPRSHRRLFHTFEQQYSGGSITHNDSREEAEKAEYLLREKHMIIYISSESFNLPNQAPDSSRHCNLPLDLALICIYYDVCLLLRSRYVGEPPAAMCELLVRTLANS